MGRLEIRNLHKNYGDIQAVNNLNLTIEKGSFFGLLGPNGAGKSTTIGMIAGLVKPTSGTITIGGIDAWKNPLEARKLVGLCPQEFNFDDFLGLEKILAFHAGYFGMPWAKAIDRARELLKFFELYDRREKRTSTLSGGMKRRFMLARALMHEPEFLILDEPTAGVDVELRRSLWEYVRDLNSKGTTVLLTTHYLEEAEALCDEVAVINGGTIIEQDSPDSLRDRYGSRRVILRLNDYSDKLDLAGFSRDGNTYALEGIQTTEALRTILRSATTNGLDVLDLEVTRSRLEDVFVQLTGGK